MEFFLQNYLVTLEFSSTFVVGNKNEKKYPQLTY